MKVRDLINLLAAEDPGAEVRIVDSRKQEVNHDFSYNSRAAGVSELPVKLVMLMAQIDKRSYRNG